MNAVLIDGASALVQGHSFEGLEATLATIRQHVDAASPRHWLGDVYSFVAQGRSDEAVDLLFRHVDDLLLAEDFRQCDALLQTIDLKRLDGSLIVSLLTMTAPAASKLPYRPALRQRARKALELLVPDRVDKLLRGL